jgi:hypothetical protein
LNQQIAISELQDLLDLLSRYELSLYINSVIKIKSRIGNHPVDTITTNRYTQVTTGPTYETENDDDFFSPEYYIQSFRNGDFSAVLFDGSLIQVRFDFRNDRLVGHRLCYFPMPCTVDEELLAEYSPADVVELYVSEEPKKIRLRSPIRIDYNQYVSTSEPSVHLHLIQKDARLAAVGPLSLGHFVSFVFRTFYPKIWADHLFLRDFPRSLSIKNIERIHEVHPHVSWHNDDGFVI